MFGAPLLEKSTPLSSHGWDIIHVLCFREKSVPLQHKLLFLSNLSSPQSYLHGQQPTHFASVAMSAAIPPPSPQTYQKPPLHSARNQGARSKVAVSGERQLARPATTWNSRRAQVWRGRKHIRRGLMRQIKKSREDICMDATTSGRP